MRALLSTIGSRGDVQPLLALAVQLRTLGHDAHLCVPPDFRGPIEDLGFTVTTIGPELRKMTAAGPPAATAPMTPEMRRKLAEGTVGAQFETVSAAAHGCDIIVAATALQIAARSVAEKLGLPYVFVAYCPAVLPSAHHAPPPLPPLPGQASAPAADNRELWVRDAERFNGLFGDVLNAHRASLGLSPVSDVRSHIFGDQVWLASDPTLGPWPDPEDRTVLQTGAWILPDKRPLPDDVEMFLDEGEPPVYFGFGSIRAPYGLSAAMIDAARAVGRRAIVSRGWAELSLTDNETDCLAIGDVNLQELLTRVAAAVHHGGAGTTTTAALAGAPQVLIPQLYDQHYWARRTQELGIGVAHAPGAPTAESLTTVLDEALQPNVGRQARAIAAAVRLDGAEAAARSVVKSARS